MVQLLYLYRQVLYLVISNLSVVVVTQTVPWLFIVEPTEPPITALTCVIFIRDRESVSWNTVCFCFGPYCYYVAYCVAKMGEVMGSKGQKSWESLGTGTLIIRTQPNIWWLWFTTRHSSNNEVSGTSCWSHAPKILPKNVINKNSSFFPLVFQTWF